MKSSIDLYRSTTLEKKGSRHNPQLDDRLICGSVPSFSLTTTNETVGKRQASVGNQLLGLPGLQLATHLTHDSKIELNRPIAATWSSDHSTIYHNLHLCLAIANDISLAIESIRVDWKVTLMQLGYHLNSYNLMHIHES
jgi:hypothetical protein